MAEAQAADIDRAVTAAREAFDHGPWARLSHAERAAYLRAIGAEIRRRSDDIVQMWPRESGVTVGFAATGGPGAQHIFDYYAGLADTFAWERPVKSPRGFGLVVKEPVGVVGAIVPWNTPMALISIKVAPALIAGCTVVLKTSPEAPGEGYLISEAAEAVGLPPGVLNVVCADREVSELLVRDPGSTRSPSPGPPPPDGASPRSAASGLPGSPSSWAASRPRSSSMTPISRRPPRPCGGRVPGVRPGVRVAHPDRGHPVPARRDGRGPRRVVLEGQGRRPVRPGGPDGPAGGRRQRTRVEGYIARGIEGGATLATGGGRPKGLDRGWYVEPTVFGNVDNSSVIAQEEIFGPVLSVIPAADEDDAVRIANETIYGLHGAVFTKDNDRAREVAGRMRTGNIGHNGFKTDFEMGFGGFKQSGIGREGGELGLMLFLESKAILLDGPTSRYPTCCYLPGATPYPPGRAR